MTMFAALKSNARVALRKNWGKAIGVIFIECALVGILYLLQYLAVDTMVIDPMRAQLKVQDGALRYLITPVQIGIWGVFVLLNFLLTVPLQMGTYAWYLDVVKGESPSFGSMFRNFENIRLYFRSIWAYVNLSIRTFFWAVVFYLLPSAILYGSVFLLQQNQLGNIRQSATFATLGFALSLVLFVLATMLYVAAMNKYMLTPYLLGNNRDMSVIEAISTSVRYTKGYRFSLLWYQFSFVGWIILCALFPPLLLYVTPYLRTSMAMYSYYIIERCVQEPVNPTKEFPLYTEKEAPFEQIPWDESSETKMTENQGEGDAVEINDEWSTSYSATDDPEPLYQWNDDLNHGANQTNFNLGPDSAFED